MNCEICGKNATIAVTDKKEVLPRSQDDSRDTRWEDDGLPHFFCDEHARAPIHNYLSRAAG